MLNQITEKKIVETTSPESSANFEKNLRIPLQYKLKTQPFNSAKHNRMLARHELIPSP